MRTHYLSHTVSITNTFDALFLLTLAQRSGDLSSLVFMGGEKKALIVGFNYPESETHIKSPANSATRFMDCLMTYYGFLSNDITLMLDENPLLNCYYYVGQTQIFGT